MGTAGHRCSVPDPRPGFQVVRQRGGKPGGLFLQEMLGFADFAAGFAHATFDGAFGFHAAIANQAPGFLFSAAFKFFCGSARSVSTTCFHNNAKCRADPQEASGVKRGTYR